MASANTGAGSISITARSNFNPNLMVRSHNAASNNANRVAMTYHAQKHIPEHFKAGAGRKYGYRRRTSSINLGFLARSNPGAYSRVKRLASKGGDRFFVLGAYKDVKSVLGRPPVVWSGETREMATNASNQKVTATATRGRLRIRTPSYIASRLKRGKTGKARQSQREALKRAAELEAMTAGEIRKLRKVFGDEYVAIQKPNHPLHAKLGIKFRQRARRRK
jgi:hypothetical protein